jgi:hypothetical protein
MFDFLKREKWALVKTFKIDRPVSPSGKHVYHIHCYESNKANRKAEYVCDGEPYRISDKVWLPTTDFYQMQMVRWLNGRRDPEIPMYEQIPEEDTAIFLKGKVN